MTITFDPIVWWGASSGILVIVAMVFGFFTEKTDLIKMAILALFMGGGAVASIGRLLEYW